MSTNLFWQQLLETPRDPGHPGKIPGTSQGRSLWVSRGGNELPTRERTSLYSFVLPDAMVLAKL